ncbi:ribonuclease E/G [Listeria booriae]|uniref:Ribonuclease E/G n=1 Tax=Listeria booriae TaxID=1552123 RepID=A0A841XX47_9LIST|nr:ribonuclease E/G [Listeria booriae]MBC1316220.1 ribonuclease E/G [Listeria booriae]
MRIVVNAVGKEKRVAFLDGNQLVDLEIMRPSNEPQVSDIYLGTIVKIDQKLKTAFVNIGYKENAFIHLKDIPATKTVHEGLKLPVQVKREGSATKAALLTGIIELSQSALVYSYGSTFVAVSRKIPMPEKEAIQQQIAPLLSEQEGVIIRSAAVDVLFVELEQMLIKARQEMQGIIANTKGANRKLYSATESIASILHKHPLATSDAEIICDDAECRQQLKASFTNVTLFHEKGGIFSTYNLEVAINRLLRPTVFLSNGTSLVIEKTEAMWVIDINSGNFKGKSDHVASSVNLSTVSEIGRQMKLRNMSGLILIDFMSGMDKQQLATLRTRMEEMAALDQTTLRVEAISENGLMQLTRRKRQKSLLEEMHCTCPVCEGTGFVASAQTLIYQMERELRGVFASDPSYVAVTVTMDVMDAFLDEIVFDGDIDWMIADDVKPFYRISQVEH